MALQCATCARLVLDYPYGVIVSVRVKPGSSRGPLVQTTDDGLVVFLRERAVEGKANAALIATLAAHYGVAKSRVSIVGGHSARIKRVRIER